MVTLRIQELATEAADPEEAGRKMRQTYRRNWKESTFYDEGSSILQAATKKKGTLGNEFQTGVQAKDQHPAESSKGGGGSMRNEGWRVRW